MKKLTFNLKWFFSKKNNSQYLKIKEIDDLPVIFEEKTVYLVGVKYNIWLLAFKCPCGCSDVIYLNTLRNSTPSWRFKVKNNMLSIYPSIKRTVGCYSHFHIKESRVIWDI